MFDKFLPAFARIFSMRPHFFQKCPHLALPACGRTRSHRIFHPCSEPTSKREIQTNVSKMALLGRESTARKKSANESAGRESASRESTSRESSGRESAARESAACESAAHDSAARESAVRETAACDSAACESAARVSVTPISLSLHANAIR